MNEILQLIEKRTSLRLFSDRQISRENKTKLLHAAMRAPTGGNLMSYTIIDVTDQTIKEKLSVTCDNQPMIAKAPMVLVFLADMQRLYDYFTYSEVPELCKKKGLPFATPQEGDFLLAADDANVAAQNVVLAAESIGLGSCYIGDIIENIEEHRKLLSLPPWTFPVTMLILGYPKKSQASIPVPRFPQEFIVHENSYHRFSGKDFDRMVQNHSQYFPTTGSFPHGAGNYGQHIYLKKFASEFMIEMRRSLKKGLQEWIFPPPA